MPVYSHSRLQTYETCPQKYKLRYIDRIELPEGEEGEDQADLDIRAARAYSALRRLSAYQIRAADTPLKYRRLCPLALGYSKVRRFLELYRCLFLLLVINTLCYHLILRV